MRRRPVERPAATRLTLAASPDEAAYDSTVTLSGRLTSHKVGLAGEKVVVKHRPHGSHTWTKVGSVLTRRSGAWSMSAQVRLSGHFKAVYRGSATHAPAKAAKTTVDTAAFLTGFAVVPGGRDAQLGEAWTFTGRTAPELAGSPVRLVRGPLRSSTTVTAGTVGEGGAISLTHRMGDVGQHDYWLSVDGGLLMYGARSPHTSIRTCGQARAGVVGRG
jgi:hypothetical protein